MKLFFGKVRNIAILSVRKEYDFYERGPANAINRPKGLKFSFYPSVTRLKMHSLKVLSQTVSQTTLGIEKHWRKRV